MSEMEAKSWTEYGGWIRRVTRHTGNPNFLTIQTGELLDEEAAANRLWHAIQARPDGAVRDWLDYALNGSGEGAGK